MGWIMPKQLCSEEGRWLHSSISEIKNDRQLNDVSKFNSLRGCVIEDDISSKTGSTGTVNNDNDLMETDDSALEWSRTL